VSSCVLELWILPQWSDSSLPSLNPPVLATNGLVVVVAFSVAVSLHLILNGASVLFKAVPCGFFASQYLPQALLGSNGIWPPHFVVSWLRPATRQYAPHPPVVVLAGLYLLFKFSVLLLHHAGFVSARTDGWPYVWLGPCAASTHSASNKSLDILLNHVVFGDASGDFVGNI